MVEDINEKESESGPEQSFQKGACLDEFDRKPWKIKETSFPVPQLFIASCPNWFQKVSCIDVKFSFGSQENANFTKY